MGGFLRALVALAVGAAAGALAVALQPHWADDINRIAAPILAKFQFNIPIHKPTPAVPYPSAVPIKNSMDGGFDHFLGPYGSIRTANGSPEDYFLGSVRVTIVIGKNGHVLHADTADKRAEYATAAAAIARRWTFIPFERNGQPVVAKIETSVQIHPLERRQDYGQPFPEIEDRSSLRIGLARTGCFGTCPSYRVEIDGDGKVTYQGGAFVAIPGEHHASIDRRAVDGLVERFRRARFFTLLDDYTASITDNPTYVISIAFDGRTKSVKDYVGLVAGMPDAVHDLEDAIDRAAGTNKWLYGNAETVPSLRAESWDFKSTKPENLAIAPGIAQFGTLEALKDLIATGAPLTASARMDLWPSRYTALELAARRSDAQMVGALLSANTKWPTSVLSSAALLGARSGSSEIVSRLISGGADSKFKDADGHTLLMSGAEAGTPDVISAILDFKTNPFLAGKTPAAHPGSNSQTDENSDVNAHDAEGKTALMLNSSSFGDTDRLPGYDRGKCVDILVAAGARVDMRDKNGDTALTSNAVHADVAAALIKAGADVNAQNAAGETALMKALTRDVVEVLLEAGADPYIQNAQGRTALELLEQNGLSKDGAAFLKTWMESHPKSK
ncbi:MAG: hypothetical protein GC190_16950 [Alphaproteobacteria bacterium]|nr:hypothetical protein [Alphaproteobacteria bacterium]